MKILKFGGTSVKDSESVEQVIKICKSELEKEKIAVVVSAFSGITNDLLFTTKKAINGNINYIEDYEIIRERVLNFALPLLTHQQIADIKGDLIFILDDLKEILHSVYTLKECTKKTMDYVMAHGEIFSAKIIASAFSNKGIESEYLDACKLIKTNSNYGRADVNFEQTDKNIKQYFKKTDKLQIITGFIGSNEHEFTTTLGRGGSDYTASIFASALNCTQIEIWKDVDGIMTANPHLVEDALPILELEFEEATELSHFGAKVIYAPTFIPAMNKKIPIVVKNTFNPNFKGSTINFTKKDKEKKLITSITSIDKMCILRIEGCGMVGKIGISRKIFEALAIKDINIVSIIQGSSEHSICICIEEESAHIAKEAMCVHLEKEFDNKTIENIIIDKSKSILTLVGSGMKHQIGIAQNIFGALAKYNINTVAIAQGSSETSISCVIESKDELKALRSVHQEFFSETTDLNLYIVGIGTVGKELLKLICENHKTILKDLNIRLKIMGITDTKKMIFANESSDLMKAFCDAKDYKKYLHKNSNEKSSLPKFIDQINQCKLPNNIFVDCTSSEEAVNYYPNILQKNIHIVTPNKKANTGSYDFFDTLKQSAKKHQVKLLYETNVGASLPIIKTINNIIGAGDKITKIEAILSGTISYIFNNFDGSKKFSEVVKEAQSLGFTEPNPAEDLNGLDFARKLLILSREIKSETELKDIEVEPLIPERAVKCDNAEDFYKILEEESDPFYEDRVAKANQKSEKLKYIGYIEEGKARVSLESINSKHPFYNLSYNDNIICIYSYCYNINPLVIQGSGAGGLITASGVLQDILSIPK